jgi:hypothetical protein
MEINKKIFLTVLSQIKACKDVIVFKDSSIDGCFDILYGAKYSNEMTRCVNKMTIRLGGSSTDLFDDNPTEKLGNPIPVFLSRVKGALRDAQFCILKDGCINGIRVEVDESDLDYSMFNWIIDTYKSYSEKINCITDFEFVSLRKIDYAYMVSECAKFVSNDPTRYYMQGICFDFVKGGKDFINMVATDGRRLCILKQPASHTEYPADSELGQFIVPPAYLHVPDSDYNSAKIRLSKQYGQIFIVTEDYHFEGMFECLDGRFVNYLRVIPEITDKTQWFTLCAASFRMAINSVKSLMNHKPVVYLNAGNPESLNITVADGQQTLEIEGTASRSMLVSFMWENLSACLFDGLALTKFWLNGSSKAFLAHEAKAVRGLTLDVTKIFMPTNDSEKSADYDEFRIPIIKDELENDSSDSSLPSFVNEPEVESDSEENFPN